jgi:hypothetical protein
LNVERSSSRSRPSANKHPIAAVSGRPPPPGRTLASVVTTACAELAITLDPAGATHAAGCAGSGCQSMESPRTRPTHRARPPTDRITRTSARDHQPRAVGRPGRSASRADRPKTPRIADPHAASGHHGDLARRRPDRLGYPADADIQLRLPQPIDAVFQHRPAGDERNERAAGAKRGVGADAELAVHAAAVGSDQADRGAREHDRTPIGREPRPAGKAAHRDGGADASLVSPVGADQDEPAPVQRLDCEHIPLPPKKAACAGCKSEPADEADAPARANLMLGARTAGSSRSCS